MCLIVIFFYHIGQYICARQLTFFYLYVVDDDEAIIVLDSEPFFHCAMGYGQCNIHFVIDG
jgi:hypothetical protein